MRSVLTTFGRVLLTIGLVFTPVVLSAEPISITVESGTITWRARGSTSTLDISGDGFSALLGSGGGIASCDPCRAGDRIPLSGGGALTGGQGSFLGEPFRFDWLFDGGSLRLQSSSFDFPLSSDALVTFMAPFSMSGFLRIRLSGIPTEFQLTGSGLVTASYKFNNLWPDGTRLYLPDSFRYEFAPEPTPEPSSIMLLTAGLAAALRRIRRAAAQTVC